MNQKEWAAKIRLRMMLRKLVPDLVHEDDREYKRWFRAKYPQQNRRNQQKADANRKHKPERKAQVYLATATYQANNPSKVKLQQRITKAVMAFKKKFHRLPTAQDCRDLRGLESVMTPKMAYWLFHKFDGCGTPAHGLLANAPSENQRGRGKK